MDLFLPVSVGARHFDNLSRRMLQPILDENLMKSEGWHAFRRDLASNHYTLGVSPQVI
jgi:hypothetical protein